MSRVLLTGMLRCLFQHKSSWIAPRHFAENNPPSPRRHRSSRESDLKHHLLVAAMAAGPLLALAQQSPTTPQPFVEQQRQQERERALREQNERTVDQRPQAAPPAPVARIPESESPCFRIDRVLLVGEQSESFQWAR
jgi:hypothetical protein